MNTAPAFEIKLCPPEQLQSRIATLARPLVFTNGVFDILHRGHANYLAQARALGASLLAALLTLLWAWVVLRYERTPQRSAALWASGVILFWGLVMSRPLQAVPP